MKYVLICLLTAIISMNAAYCADDKSSSKVWGADTGVFNQGFENQEPVSDSKLKKTIETLKERNKTKKQKKLQSQIAPVSTSADSEHLEEFVKSQDTDSEQCQSLTVMIPVSAYSEDGIKISPGYYKLSCHKVAENEYVLELSQGTNRILTVKAMQTQQDFEQDTISFCNAEIIDGERIRLIYGTIDLNLVGYLYFN